MGRVFVINLEGRIYSCKHCQTNLALYDDIISRSFHCKHGKAYLFNKDDKRLGGLLVFQEDLVSAFSSEEKFINFTIRVNVTAGLKEDRMMMTGLHTVADIFCVGCGSLVGWKYEAAHEKSQKYKEGKFILERFKVTGPDGAYYWGSEAQVAGSDADDA